MVRIVAKAERVYRHPIHFCVFDRQCRALGAPKRIYFHFLKREDGSSLYLSFDKKDYRGKTN